MPKAAPVKAERTSTAYHVFIAEIPVDADTSSDVRFRRIATVSAHNDRHAIRLAVEPGVGFGRASYVAVPARSGHERDVTTETTVQLRVA